MTEPRRWPSQNVRRVARLVATAASFVFLASLLVMARWILHQEGPAGLETPLPSARDTVIPLIAMTVASATFPIAFLAFAILMNPPESEDSEGPASGSKERGDVDRS